MSEPVKLDNGAVLYTILSESSTLKSEKGYFFVNKICLNDGSSLYPAVYADFGCPETGITDEALYSEYLNMRKLYPYENIFVFAFAEDSSINKDLLSFIVSRANDIVSCQNELNGKKYKEKLSAFVSSSYYEEFNLKYGFTVSEELSLKKLLYYAVLSEIDIKELIALAESELSENKNRKLIRKEFLNVLTAKLS